MLDWFDKHHPGVASTFCHTRAVARSRSKAAARSAITKDACQDHFQRTLSKSKWEKIRGWHCLRHSFISNLACAGVDQRLIDEFVGHTTEEMRRRYRHLFPDVKQAAIDKVFG
jgi:integrase